MSLTELPTPELMRQLLIYQPASGRLTWDIRSPDLPVWDCDSKKAREVCTAWNKRFAGEEAFTYVGKDDYRVGSIKPYRLKAHRVAWAIYYGEWPAGQIDHINRDRLDNRITNLREVTHQENLRNCSVGKNNKSGVTGAFWSKECRKWCAQITTNRKARHLGLFDTLEEAAAARRNAERTDWDYIARTQDRILG